MTQSLEGVCVEMAVNDERAVRTPGTTYRRLGNGQLATVA